VARIDVIMPQMGESIAEGTLSRWLKQVGDPVKRDEPIFEISTDKVDAEIPASSAGVLAEILVQEGQTVPVQTVVARLETEAGAPIAAGEPAATGGACPPLNLVQLRRPSRIHLPLRQAIQLRSRPALRLRPAMEAPSNPASARAVHRSCARSPRNTGSSSVPCRAPASPAA